MPKLIVFDMDGVLVDVSASYRECVRQTARLFFNGARGFAELPDPLFPLADLADLKQTGGLNNDWDLTAQVLHLLFAEVAAVGNRPLSDRGAGCEESLRALDLSGLTDFLRRSSSPLMELLDRHGRRQEPLITHCYRGDIGTGNRIKRIFQEIYLGCDLFSAIYREEPRFYHQQGLIHRESLLIDAELLADLSRNHLLAIATGRPRAEADYPLDRFGIRRYFKMVVTLDDCIDQEERLFRQRGERVSLQKPDPYSLDLIPERIGKGFSECYYLGDMPDDMQAARASRAGYRGVGILMSTTDPENRRQALLRAGADQIIADGSALRGLFGS